jgi:pantetheine-phosphate adenylyltransferase
MEKIAVFAGSFDPITVGHVSVVKRGMPLFDKVYIAVGRNTKKEEFFPLEKRMEWIKKVFEYEEKVIVDSYSGLTIEYCKKVKATHLLRGLRNGADFDYEWPIAQLNKAMHPEIESVFLLTLPEHTHINSTIVREIISHGGNASQFLPEQINLEGWYLEE